MSNPLFTSSVSYTAETEERKLQKFKAKVKTGRNLVKKSQRITQNSEKYLLQI